MSIWLQILIWGIAVLALSFVALLIASFFQWLRYHRSDKSTTEIQ